MSLSASMRVSRKLETILSQTSNKLEVENINDGNKAKTLIENFTYKVIICDVENWNKSNGNVCQFFRRNYKKQFAHWIFLTTMQNKHHISECLGEGKSDYLLYPCDDTFLAAKINNAIKLHEFHKEKCESSHLYKIPQTNKGSSGRQTQPLKKSGLSDLKNKRTLKFTAGGIEYVLQANAVTLKDPRSLNFSQESLLKTFKKVLTDMDLTESEKNVSTHMYVKKKRGIS